MKKVSYELADVDLAQRGDKKAMDRVVRSMNRLVHYMAKRYASKTPFDYDELAQEARVAVMRAAKLFNPKKGLAFHNYCYTWIRAFIQRLGSSSQRRRRGATEQLSIDMQINETDGLSLIDVLASDEPSAYVLLELGDQDHKARGIISRLEGRDGDIVRARAAGKTFTQISEEFDLSRQRIEQIQQASVSRMRRSARLRGYLQ